MASVHIRKRTITDGSNRYDVRYRRGGRYFPVEHAGTFTSLKDARTRRDLVSGWLAANVDPAVMLAVASPTLTLSRLADQWLASRLSVTDASRANYRRHLNLAVELLGDRHVQDIQPADVREYVARLTERLSPGTVSMHLNTLRAALDHADLPANPARHRSVEKPRREPKDLQPPDADEYLAILAHLPLRFRGVLVVMEQTGLRVSEALGLEREDVSDGTIRLRREIAKGGRPRTVPIPLWLAERVELPFGLTRQRCWNRLATAADDAGVPRYGPHQWRHRRATLWHLQGVPAVEVSRRLGHAKVSMTLDRYTHARPVREADAQRLAELL